MIGRIVNKMATATTGAKREVRPIRGTASVDVSNGFLERISIARMEQHIVRCTRVFCFGELDVDAVVTLHRTGCTSSVLGREL